MKQKINSYVSSWTKRGYENGIPDESPPELEAHNKVPSYRMICRAIMRNDVSLSTLGFSRVKTPEYMALKKIEIEARK
jgi:predicted phosphoadenosine phosphosulfate sulfurtransferase